MKKGIQMPQSLSQILIHIIFSTRGRFPFLYDDQVQTRMHCYIKSVCFKQNCYAICVGGTEDHVHILTTLSKDLSLAKLVEEIKKSSSKWVKTLANSENNLEKFYWQRGYGAFSVSQSALPAVEKYIQNQQTHHARQSFQEEYRKILNLYNVKYEEAYVWD